MVSRRTQKRHEEMTFQLSKLIVTVDDSLPDVSRQETIQYDAIDTTTLLLNYQSHLLSNIVLENKTSKSKSTYVEELKHSMMVCTAVLHCALGLSRIKANKILKFLKTILKYTKEELGLKEVDTQLCLDIRSVTNQLGIEPVLFQTVCCPKCFFQYDLNNLIKVCNQRESARAKYCGADLRGEDGQPKQIYSTQSLTAWVSSILQYNDIEKELDASATHIPPEGGTQKDVWDSPLWRELKDGKTGSSFFSAPGNFGFSLFYDGFNPYGNKVAG